MATSKYSPHTADVNRPDRGRDSDLLSVEALKRAHTLVREIEESERNRQYLLQSDARARVWLSIISAPSPSYEMPGRGIIELRCSDLVAILEEEIAERQQELRALGVEAPAIEPRPARWNEPYDLNR
jgi:hypothetical protein